MRRQQSTQNRQLIAGRKCILVPNNARSQAEGIRVKSPTSPSPDFVTHIAWIISSDAHGCGAAANHALPLLGEHCQHLQQGRR